MPFMKQEGSGVPWSLVHGFKRMLMTFQSISYPLTKTPEARPFSYVSLLNPGKQQVPNNVHWVNE